MLHTHLHAETKQRQFILLLSPHCALALISTVQQGPFYAFTESFSLEDIQMIFNVLFFFLRNAYYLWERLDVHRTNSSLISRLQKEGSLTWKFFSDPESSAAEQRVEERRAAGLKCEINHPQTYFCSIKGSFKAGVKVHYIVSFNGI